MGNCFSSQPDAAESRTAAAGNAAHNAANNKVNNTQSSAAAQSSTQNYQSDTSAQVNPAAIQPKADNALNTGTTVTSTVPITNQPVVVHEDPNSTRTSDQILSQATTATNTLQQQGSSALNTASDKLNQSAVFNTSNVGATGESANQIENDISNTGNNVSNTAQQGYNDISNQVTSAVNGSGSTTATDSNAGSGISGRAAAGVAAVTGAAAAAGATASSYLNKSVDSVKNAAGLQSDTTSGVTTTDNTQSTDTSTYNSGDGTGTSTNADGTTQDANANTSRNLDGTTGATSAYDDASSSGVDSTYTGNTQGTATASDLASQPNTSSSGGISGLAAGAVAAATGAVATAGTYAASSVNTVKQAVGLGPTGQPATGGSDTYRDASGNAAATDNQSGAPSYGDASSTGIDGTNTGNTQGNATAKDLASQGMDKNATDAAVAAATGATAGAVAGSTAGSTTGKTGAVKAKIYIVYYSTYGHMKTLAHTVKKGVESYGADVSVYQVPETLPKEILTKMHAPEKSTDPVISPATLAEADGIIFGMPTRYGQAAAQMKGLLDSTGQLWAKGALLGKTAGTFFGTASPAGGQETTAFSFITQLTHHGMIYVPIGYSNPSLFSEELHGGSPYGPGTYAGGDGSRQPSELELGVAEHLGKHFAQITSELKLGRQTLAQSKQQ